MLSGRRPAVYRQRRELIAIATASICLFAARPVMARQTTPVSEVLPNLFGNTIVLNPASSPEFPSHAAHFRPGVDQLQTPQQFNQQLVSLLATFPSARRLAVSRIPSIRRSAPSAGAARASARCSLNGR